MTDNEWAQIAPYMGGSRLYYELLEPDYEGAEYRVCANVWSEEANDYIGHFEGHTFDNYEMAWDFWANWMPDKDAVRRMVQEFHEEGTSEHYEVETGIWEDGDLTDEGDFYTETVVWR